MNQFENFNKHIYKRYNDELETLYNELLNMSGMVEQQLVNAYQALCNNSLEHAEEASVLENIINKEEIIIDSESLKILARHNPTASDLRLVLSVIKIANHLENIANEVVKVSQITESVNNSNYTYSNKIVGFVELEDYFKNIITLYQSTLDAMAKMDIAASYKIINKEKKIRKNHQNILNNIKQFIIGKEKDIHISINILFSFSSLQTIGNIATLIAKDLIYVVVGKDVRRVDADKIKKIIEKNLD